MKRRLLTYLFLSTTFVFAHLMGCGTGDKQTEKSSAAVDSLQAGASTEIADKAKGQPEASEFEELEERKANLEQQIATMMSALAEKEKAVRAREGEVAAHSAQLDSLSSSLAAKNQSIERFFYFSIVMVVIGLAMFACGLILYRKSKNQKSDSRAVPKQKHDAKTPAAKNADTGAKSGVPKTGPPKPDKKTTAKKTSPDEK